MTSRLFLVVLALATLSACEAQSQAGTTGKSAAAVGAEGGDASEAKPERVVLVRTATVATADLTRSLRATATLESETQAALSFQTGGRLVELGPDVGQTIEQGRPLARLDADRLALALREATLATAEADERHRESALAVREAENALARAKIDREEALAARKRAEALARGSAGSQLELDTARFRAEQTVVAVADAELRLERAKLSVEVTKTAADKAALAKERAQIDSDHAVLNAPFTGVVSARPSRVGEQVGAGQTVYELADPTRLKALVYLPQKSLREIRDGLTVEVIADACPGALGRGKVVRAPRTVDASTGNIRIDVVLEEAGPFLPGMFVTLRFLAEQRSGVAVVPKKAVRLAADGAYVYLVEGDRARELHFRPGLEDEERMEVTGGVLAPGATIVLVGIEQLKDGDKVRVAGADASPKPAREQPADGAAEAAATKAAPPPAGEAQPEKPRRERAPKGSRG